MLELPRRKIKLNKDEAGALLFHYHKHGIPPTQTAAKRLERRLCRFLGVETKDEYEAPCKGARYEGEIDGEKKVHDRLRELRRENECVGGDQRVVNAVRLIEEKGV